jgi:hypothetical protein
MPGMATRQAAFLGGRDKPGHDGESMGAVPLSAAGKPTLRNLHIDKRYLI